MFIYFPLLKIFFILKISIYVDVLRFIIGNTFVFFLNRTGSIHPEYGTRLL